MVVALPSHEIQCVQFLARCWDQFLWSPCNFSTPKAEIQSQKHGPQLKNQSILFRLLRVPLERFQIHLNDDFGSEHGKPKTVKRDFRETDPWFLRAK